MNILGHFLVHTRSSNCKSSQNGRHMELAISWPPISEDIKLVSISTFLAPLNPFLSLPALQIKVLRKWAKTDLYFFYFQWNLLHRNNFQMKHNKVIWFSIKSWLVIPCLKRHYIHNFIRYLLAVPKSTYFARIAPLYKWVNYRQSPQHDYIDRNWEIPTELLRNSSLKSVHNLLKNGICWQNWI